MSAADSTAELAIVGYLLLQPAAAAELRPLLPAHALATPWLRAAYEAALQRQLLQHCRGLTLWQLRATLEGAAAGPECCRALALHLLSLQQRRDRAHEHAARVRVAQRRVQQQIDAGRAPAPASVAALRRALAAQQE